MKTHPRTFACRQGFGTFLCRLVFASLGLLAHLQTAAQTAAECATPFYFPNSLKGRHPAEQKQLSGTIVVRLFIHLCRDDNGANQAMAEKDVLEEVRITDSVYGQGGICFAVVGIDHPNSSPLNNDILHVNVSASGTLVPNCFNVYVVQQVGNALGTAFAIPNNYIAVKPEGFGSRRTFLHELGHDLGLFHTHHGGAEESDATTCPEWANGANGESCGDYVADTPADPYTYPGTSGCNSMAYPNCVWNGTCRDVFNQLYNPQLNNYMSSWINTSVCDRNLFTPGQFQRMRQVIADTALLSDCVAPATKNLSNAVILSGNVTEAAGTSLNAGNLSGSNYSLTAGVKAYLVSPVISLKPGFLAQPSGAGYVVVQPGVCQ